MTLKSINKIILEHNLIIELHKGELDLKTYMSFKTEQLSNKQFKPNLKFLIDFTNVKFTNSVEDVKVFTDFIKSESKRFGERRIAVITNTPNQVISPTIYKQIIENDGDRLEVFSTTFKALKWLHIAHLENTINEILIELEHSI